MRRIMAIALMTMTLLCGCANTSAEPKPTMPTTPSASEIPDNEFVSSSAFGEESFSDPVNTPDPITEQKTIAEIADTPNRDVEITGTGNAKAQMPKATVAPTLKPTPTPTPTPTPEPAPVPIPTPTPEPQVDIAYWVSYAKSYASSLGLNLDSSAVDCWDNPITATSKSTCLERDISSRLSRYAADEDITDVWVWSESIGNGSYNIYIGYA